MNAILVVSFDWGYFVPFVFQVNFPYKECDLNSKLDVLLLQELKETFCHLSTVSRFDIGPN